jgi:hypothetical protein
VITVNPRLVQLLVFSASCAVGFGENVWINWDGPSGSPLTHSGGGFPSSYSYYSGATGRLTLGGSLTNVTYRGEVLATQSSYSGGNGSFWDSTNGTATAAQTYTSSTVPAGPSNNDRIAVSGRAISGGSISFDQTVTNVAMTLWSLGGFNLGQMTFNQPFSLVSSDKSTYGNGTLAPSLTKSGNTLNGYEGNGTIVFFGDFTELSWTVPGPEYYWAFTLGMTTIAPPDSPLYTGGSAVDPNLIVTGTNTFSGTLAVFQNGAFAPNGNAILPAITVDPTFSGTIDSTDGAVSSSGTVSINGTSLTLTGVNGTTLSGPITGSGSLYVTGGANVLSGSVSHTGGTNVVGGSVILGTTDSLPATGNVANGGAFVLPGANASADQNNFGQSFTLTGTGGSAGGALVIGSTQPGAGSASLSGVTTLDGAATIVTLGNGSATQTLAGPIDATSGALTILNQTGSNGVLSGSITASAPVDKQGPGKLTIDAGGAVNQGLKAAGGVVRVNNENGLNGAGNIADGGQFVLPNSGTLGIDKTFSQSFEIVGTGFDGAALVLGAADTTASMTLTGDTRLTGAATIRTEGLGNTTQTIAGNVDATLGVLTIVNESGSNGVLTGAVTAGSAVNKQGAGQFTINAGGMLNQGVNATGGVVRVNAENGLNAAGNVANGGQFLLPNSGISGVDKTFTQSFEIAGTGVDGAALVLGAADTTASMRLTGNTRLTADATIRTEGSGNTTQTIAGDVDANSGTLTIFNENGSNGVLIGAVTAASAVNKQGAGQFTINTGGTINRGVNATGGTVRVNAENGLNATGNVANGGQFLLPNSGISGVDKTFTQSFEIAGTGVDGAALVLGAADTTASMRLTGNTRLTADATIRTEGSGNTTQTIAGNVDATSGALTILNENGSNGVLIGAVTATSAVNKQGAGQFTINTGGTINRGVNATGGTVRVNAENGLNATGNVANGGQFLLPNSGTPGADKTFTQSFEIAGTGVDGAALVLGAADTTASMRLTGNTRLTADATIRTEGSGSTTQTIAGNVDATSGALTILNENGSNGVLIGAVTATSAVNKQGAGQFTINTGGTINRGVNATGGVVRVNAENGLNATGNVANGGQFFLPNSGTPGVDKTFTQSFEIAGTGVDGAALVLGAADTSSSMKLTGNTRLTGAATIRTEGSGSTTQTIAGNVDASAGALTILNESGSNGVLIGAVTASSAVNKQGAGQFTIDGAGTVNQGVNASGGVVRVNAENGLHATGNVANGGQFVLPNSGLAGSEKTFTQSFDIAGTGANGAALVLGAADTTASMKLTGDITLTAAATIRTEGSGGGTQTIAGAVSGNLFQLAFETVGESVAVLKNGISNAVKELIKKGTGKLEVAAGSEIQSDSIGVTAGTLNVNGVVVSSIRVASAARLTGSGEVSGNVLVEGALAPGNSPGVLVNSSGSTTQAAGSRYEVELGGVTAGSGNGFHDQTIVTNGSFVIASGVTLDVRRWWSADGVTAFQAMRGDVFTIIIAANGISGTFSDITNPESGTWIVYDNQGTSRQFGNLYGTGLTGGKTFADYGDNRNRRRVGGAIWDAAIQASASSSAAHPAAFLDGSSVAGKVALSLLTAASVNDVLDAYSAESYTSLGDYAITTARTLANWAADRNGLVTEGSWSFGAGYSRASKFFKGGSSGNFNYQLDSNTESASVFYEPSPAARIGVYYGYNSGSTRSVNTRSEFTGSIAGLDAGLKFETSVPLSVRVGGIVSDHSVDTSRQTPIGAVSLRDQNLRYYGFDVSASAGVYNSKTLSLEPSIGFVYGQSSSESGVEQGAGAALKIDEIRFQSARGMVGVTARYSPTPDLSLGVKSGYEREFSGDRSVTSSFASGMTATPMTTDSAFRAENWLTTGLGIGYQLAPRTVLSAAGELRSSPEVRNDYRFNASLTFKF